MHISKSWGKKYVDMLLKILYNRKLLIAYVEKYVLLYYRLLLYQIRISLRISIYQKTKNRIIYQMQKQPGGITGYIKDNMSCSFLCAEMNETLECIRRNQVFMGRLRETADLVCNNRFLILNEFWDNVLDSNGHIRWKSDLKSGQIFPAVHYSQIRKKIKLGTDIKHCWELSRMQYLFPPALMYRLTNDEKYALFVKKVLIDWAEHNEWEEGPNWSPSMETGIRITNILLVFQLISSSRILDDTFCATIIAMAHLHYRFIMRNEENVGGRTSNHYLGALIGLLSISKTFPFLPYSANVSLYVENSLEKEIQKQIFPDGGSFEGSTAYQQLVGEIFSLASVLRQNTGDRFSDVYYQQLLKMLKYAICHSKPDGTFTQIGDNDGGHIFRLMPVNVPDNSFFISLASAVLTNNTSFTKQCHETGLFCVTSSEPKIEDVKKSYLFSVSKQAIYCDNVFFLHFNASNTTIHGRGHTHNDKLSFELSCFGVNFISDPGTGVYTSYPNIRNSLRSVMAHSTVQVGPIEQNSFSKKVLFSMHDDVDITSFQIDNNTDIVTFSGTIQRKNAPIYIHKRIICINSKEARVRITDVFSEMCTCSTIWRIILYPDVQVNILGNTAVLSNKGVLVQMIAYGEIKVCDGLYARNYGKWEKTRVLEIHNQNTKSGIEYICEFKIQNKNEYSLC